MKTFVAKIPQFIENATEFIKNHFFYKESFFPSTCSALRNNRHRKWRYSSQNQKPSTRKPARSCFPWNIR